MSTELSPAARKREAAYFAVKAARAFEEVVKWCDGDEAKAREMFEFSLNHIRQPKPALPPGVIQFT